MGFVTSLVTETKQKSNVSLAHNFRETEHSFDKCDSAAQAFIRVRMIVCCSSCESTEFCREEELVEEEDDE
tara:strand:- start:71 stop:283 length:213 start_codon:yes stop_codon:yes gene_type:complete